MAKTLIFIDLDNIYRGLLEHYGVEPNVDNFFKAIREREEKAGNEIVEIYAFADFSRIGNRSYRSKLEMSGVITKDVFGANKDLARKNASDVELSISAVDAVYNYSDVENYTIISADSDMIPLIRYLKSKGKKVSLLVIEKQSNPSILENHPNNGFETLEKVLGLTEISLLEEHEIINILPKFVNEIYQKEEYNKSKDGNRPYQSYENFKWRAMRFIVIDGKRLCSPIIRQVIEYAQKKGILTLNFSKNIRAEEIILNREHEMVKNIQKII